jgi:hypothetical protein
MKEVGAACVTIVTAGGRHSGRASTPNHSDTAGTPQRRLGLTRAPALLDTSDLLSDDI